tara:strand:- start:17673 stop:17834 length:162 start_codon:yes stop_codon:yes gene_type:complete
MRVFASNGGVRSRCDGMELSRLNAPPYRVKARPVVEVLSIASRFLIEEGVNST